MTDPEQRFVDLEARYVHLEREVEALSDVVAEQAKTIDRLTRDLENLRAFVVEGGPSVSVGDSQDKPPHY